MKLLKVLTDGFFLGLGISLVMGPAYNSSAQTNYIDQDKYDDKDIEKVILVDIPQIQ